MSSGGGGGGGGGSELLAEVTRGALAESLHRGHVAAVDGGGGLVARLGEPETCTYVRSSSKPHQALPVVASGAADRFGFSEQEIALICGSHNGEPVHTETVASMLAKLGLGPESLKCGVHEPYGPEVAEGLRERREGPNVLHNNCSGKHAGMLALALHTGASPDTYDEASSPVQLAMLDAMALFTGMPVAGIAVAPDGCGVPTFGVTVRAMALMFLRLLCPPEAWDARTRDACRRLVRAMRAYPEMVEGAGEVDTELIRQTRGRVISKVGAEGVYAAAVMPCDRWPAGLGLAFKIEDGDKNDRARSPLIIECLRQLGALGAEELEALSNFASTPVYNHRKEQVGVARPCFELRGL